MKTRLFRRAINTVCVVCGCAAGANAQNTTNTGTLYVSGSTTLLFAQNFNNNTGATLQAPGALRVNGNWTNNGTFTPGSGTVTFGGSSQQSLTKPAGETFYRLIINNGSSTGQVLLDSVTVTDSLTLTDGVVYVSSGQLFTLGNGARSTSGSSASFIHGQVRKIGNQAFVFPIGDSTVWARLGITAPTLATTEYTAQYFDSTYTDVTVLSPLVNVSVVEYWTLTQAVNDDDVKVTLYWEDSIRSGIDDCPDLSVARYNGADWEEQGQFSITCGFQGNVTSNTVLNYSPFTFGSKSAAVNPLPVELLFFNATLQKNNTVLCEWITATESNTDFFTVERNRALPAPSVGGVGAISPEGWETVTKIPAAGNSTQNLYYTAVDETPSHGLSYYRLKITDFDGSFSYSHIVPINLKYSGGLLLFPIPATDRLHIIFSSADTSEIHLEITDVLGRKMNVIDIPVSEGENVLSVDVSGLSGGIYFLEINDEYKTTLGRKNFTIISGI